MATQRERIESRHSVYLGFDVGKQFHWACALRADGATTMSRPVPNRREDVAATIAEAQEAAAEGDVLVTVDQRNNIGALVVREAREAGCDVAYLPGSAEKAARSMYPVLAKTDEIDAWVIARTSMATPEALRPVPDCHEARLLGSQRRHCTKLATQATNRLRAVMLESDPSFESACELGKQWTLEVLAELGGACGIAAAGRRRYRSLCARASAPAEAADELWTAAKNSAESPSHPAGEDRCVMWQARRVLEARGEAEAIRAQLDEMLVDDECYQCLRTVPGIGPVAAEALVSLVDISLFDSHDQLASFCGLAPADSKSGTSVEYNTTSRRGNKELKNLMIFTVNSLIGTDGYFGRYYDAVLERSSGDAKLKRKRALKAVARKRLKIIFAVMRDLVPYDAERWEATA
ncbi:MAG: IS110 family transposase [Eggerthellaceae bacterium]|nr:IS110 family transposase [Eggerthellaceae bacterium]MBQ9068591.1 IS110 family transposase [Eggerthellaceae bacterium]